MSLVSLKELLETANKNNFAVGYFEAWDLYSLEAVALAAEKENSPIVLGFGGMTVNQEWINSFGIEPLGRYANELAKSLSVPAAVYLNEVYEIDHAKRGIKSGFNSVLLETSNLSYEENINTTKELVKFAHSNDAHVQGEVGHLPDFFEDNDSDKLTDPNKAKNFINLTNIDFLGVSIGNVHMFSKGNYNPQLDLLSRINEIVEIPLVIHGTTGFPEDKIDLAIKNGVAMFQVGTIIKETFFNEIKKNIQNIKIIDNVHDYVGSRKEKDFLEPGKSKIIDLISKYINLFHSNNKKNLYGK